MKTLAALANALFGRLNTEPTNPGVMLPPPTQPDWTPATKKFVQDDQEEQCRDLAADLHLGNDPMAAYKELSDPFMPLSHASQRLPLLKEAYGENLTPEDWERFEALSAKYYDQHASYAPPTLYEDPNRYALIMMIFDGVRDAFIESAPAVRTLPLLATLPSGETNAGISVEPTTGTPIIFFERGLFQFVYNFCLCIAWAMPHLTLQQFGDDSALDALPLTYTMPPEASLLFVDLMVSYVTRGSPVPATPPPFPAQNAFAASGLLQRMEDFIMLHELRHLANKDIDQPSVDKETAWQQEYQADIDAAALTILRHASSGIAISFWSCYLALTAFHLLDRAIAVVAFSGRVSWTNKTHPDALSRRERLRDNIRTLTPGFRDSRRVAALTLCNMTDSLLGRLMEFAVPVLVANRSAGVSPLWRKHIARTFKEVTDA